MHDPRAKQGLEGCLTTWCPRVFQAALKGFKKVVCFESSPLNFEATKAAVRQQNVSILPLARDPPAVVLMPALLRPAKC